MLLLIARCLPISGSRTPTHWQPELQFEFFLEVSQRSPSKLRAVPNAIAVDRARFQQMPGERVQFVTGLGSSPMEGLAGIMLLVASHGQFRDSRNGVGEIGENAREQGQRFARRCVTWEHDGTS
jgi:hypothetical protein